MYRFGSFLLMVTTLIMAQVIHASTWDINPAHTNAQFAVRHLMVSTVRGQLYQSQWDSTSGRPRSHQIHHSSYA